MLEVGFSHYPVLNWISVNKLRLTLYMIVRDHKLNGGKGWELD